MGSLFDFTIEKKDALNRIANHLKKNNLTMDFRNKKLIIFNENYDSKITNVTVSKTTKGEEVIEVFYTLPNSSKENKVVFKLFTNKTMSKQLDEILNSPIDYFD